jgi:hypothetical protein
VLLLDLRFSLLLLLQFDFFVSRFGSKQRSCPLCIPLPLFGSKQRGCPVLLLHGLGHQFAQWSREQSAPVMIQSPPPAKTCPFLAAATLSSVFVFTRRELGVGLVFFPRPRLKVSFLLLIFVFPR